MSIDSLSWAFNLDLPSSGAKLTLLALANYADADGVAYPSQKAMAKKTCLCERAIRSHLSNLERMGVISRVARTRSNGSFTSDLFQINMDWIPEITPKTPAADFAVGKNCQRQILPSPAADFAAVQRQILPSPAADSAAPEPSLNTTITKTLNVTKSNNAERAVAAGADLKKIRSNENTAVILRNLGVSDSVAKDFIQLRKSKKAAITKTALDGIEREATKAGMSLENALRTCCERGWAGFKAEWVGRDSMQAMKGCESSANQAREGARKRLFGGGNHATS